MGAAAVYRAGGAGIDIPTGKLRRLAREETTGRGACRWLAVANVLDGMSRADAASRAGMDRQTLRDWVIRFNAEGLEGLRDRLKSGGRLGWTRASWRRSRRRCRAARTRSALGFLDRAGWHIAEELAIPANLTPLFLPAYAPELNVIERIWLDLRERFLSHRLWPSHDDILDACCAACNALRNATGRIRSLCTLDRAARSVLDGTGITLPPRAGSQSPDGPSANG